MQKLFLILILAFSAPLLALADSSYQARIGGLDLPKNLFPNITSRATNPNYAFNLQLPGFGLSKIKINRLRDFKTTSTFSNSRKELRANNSKHLLFRGEVIMKSKKQPLAASTIYLKGTPYLVLSFLAVNPRNNNQQFYKIKVNLNTKAIRSARIFRASRFNHESLEHDELLIAPAIPKTLKNTIDTSIRVGSTNNKLRTIALSIDADSFWYTIYGEDSNSVISSFLNEAEAIYENDLGLKFKIVRQNVYTDQTFGVSNAVDRLCNYQYYMTGESTLTQSGCILTAEKGPQLQYGDANAYHLFTGQELDTSTIGLAFVGTICTNPDYAFALTQLTSAATTPITFAHELAHNLSAIHDNSTGSNGSEIKICPETTTPNIMNPYISLDPADSFSNCSKQLIKNHLDLHGACLNQPSVTTNNPDVGLPNNNQIKLNLKFLKNGSLTGNLSLPSSTELNSVESCELEFVVAEKSKRLAASPYRTRIAIRQSGFQMYFANHSAIKKNKAGNIPPIFFQSKLICDQKVISESKALKVATRAIQRKRKQNLTQVISKIPERIIFY